MAGTNELFYCYSMNAVSMVGYHEVIGTLKPYHMLKNLFELLAHKGSADAKTLGTSTHAWMQVLCLHPPLVLVLALEPHGETLTT